MLYKNYPPEKPVHLKLFLFCFYAKFSWSCYGNWKRKKSQQWWRSNFSEYSSIILKLFRRLFCFRQCSNKYLSFKWIISFALKNVETLQLYAIKIFLQKEGWFWQEKQHFFNIFHNTKSQLIHNQFFHLTDA